MKEKKDLAILKAFDSLSHSSFSSAVAHAFSWPIKGKAGRPIRGIATHRINSSQIRTNPSNPEHTVEQQPSSLSTRLLLSSETWGMSLSRPFVTPTMNFQC